MIRWGEWLGGYVIRAIYVLGKLSLLLYNTLILFKRFPFRIKAIINQMEIVGVNSLPVLLTTAIFTGMVLALQSYNGFKRFGAESMVGAVVALSMTRELGPVLSGLIVAGRAGSAMAAELGTMRVTEQIDAMYALAVNPIEYLIVPRFIASMIMMPLLVAITDLVGFLGGYFVSVVILKANPYTFVNKALEYLLLSDIFSGLIKAVVFGMIISIVGCYQGFYTEGGAQGVGRATTRAVVMASLMILIANYFITVILINNRPVL